MAHTDTTAGSNPHCALLELPGELRNIIYSYALHESKGLCFRQDDHGIGRLETTSSAVPAKPSTYFATCKDEKMTRRAMVKAASGAANQLQYVNHEFRKETRGLGIRYNLLSFDRLKDILLFVSICPESERKYLQKLRLRKVLYTTNDGTNEGLLQPTAKSIRLFQFCEANPNLVIENYIRGWRQSETMFVIYAILVEMQFRKTSNRVADFFTDPYFQDRIKVATAKKVISFEQVIPANFRFFPEDKKFDEATVRESTPELAKLFGTDLFDRVVEGGVERWVPLVQQIYEEGI